eukprot:2706652-Pleurochrysis_carterae.AAC.1
MVLARSQPSKTCSHERKAGTYVKSVAWTMRKVRRMGHAEGSLPGTCTGSITWCSCEAIRRKLSYVMNANLDAVRFSANGPYT